MELGQRVTGNYCGSHQFTGVITSRRPITVRTADGAIEYGIQLDAPIAVYGETRDVLLMQTQFDGAASAYNGYSCSMVPA